MSDIQAGDVVQVVRHPCCGVHIGRVFVVSESDIVLSTYVCDECKTRHGLITGMARDQPGSGYAWYPWAWLKKYTPLAEPEDVEHKEEQPA